MVLVRFEKEQLATLQNVSVFQKWNETQQAKLLPVFQTHRIDCSLWEYPLPHPNIFNIKTQCQGASLVAQWLRIHLPMQGTRVRALVQEDPTCRGATKPMRHNY